MSTLDILGKLNGTDKSSNCHNYCVKYEKYLPFNRYDDLKILEIGVLHAKSLKMWKDYYYRSQIVGIDILPECKQYEDDRISIEIGSQNDFEFLKQVSEKHGLFDMILDDGTHRSSDVIFSFVHLFESIKSGEVYIVEDCATSYWEDFGGGYLKSDSTIEYFKRLVDDVNFRGLRTHLGDTYRKESVLIPLSEKVQPYCRVDIESINFLSGIIIITKR